MNGPTTTVTVPGLPPSLNHLYPMGRDGRRHMSAAGRDWYKTVALACLVGRVPRYTNPKVRLAAAFEFVGLPYTRDVSNCVKALEDSLAAALGFEDRYIEAISAVRVPAERRGQLETRVSLVVMSRERRVEVRVFDLSDQEGAVTR